MPQYSPLSVESLDSQPGHAVASSEGVGWRSLYVQERACPTSGPPFDARATDDQTIVVFLNGSRVLESWNRGRWRSAFRWRGTAGLTAPGEIDRLRWGHDVGGGDAIVQAAYIYLPQQFLFETLDAVEASETGAGAGARRDPASLSMLRVDDPVLHGIATGLIGAMRLGVPDMYAETAALHLSMHLLHLPLGGLSALREDRCARGPDRRIARAIDYMRANVAGEISIDMLAREACISPFHFVRVFKRQVGRTPMRFLTELRMERADSLLTKTDLPVAEVAALCGYRSTAAFSAAVRRLRGKSPCHFRSPARQEFDSALHVTN